MSSGKAPPPSAGLETQLPAVSVCLPTRNRAQSLRAALESVLSQTYADFEICVSDNASSDETPQVMASFRDPRLHIHRNDTDIGSFRNQIVAIGMARGRYVAAIHDDTAWSPTFLERLVTPLEADSALDLSFCDHWVADGSGKISAELSDAYSRSYGRQVLSEGKHQPYTRLVLADRAILLTAAVIRRERITSIGMLDPHSGFVIDFHLFARLSQANRAAWYVPERLATYAVHRESISGRRQLEVWRDMRWSCQDLYQRAGLADERALIQARWADAIANETLAAARTPSWRHLPRLAGAIRELPSGARGRIATQAAALTLRRVIARTRRTG